jgi:hypothetical protein
MKKLMIAGAAMTALPAIVKDGETIPMEEKQPAPKTDSSTPTTGAQRAQQRAMEKRRENMEAERRRALTNAEAADTSDVFFDGVEGDTEGAVLVKGLRVGIWKKMGDKFVLFGKSGVEVSSRARQRDLKKAAAGLYEPPAKTQPMSRQVRRRMERKGW